MSESWGSYKGTASEAMIDSPTEVSTAGGGDLPSGDQFQKKLEEPPTPKAPDLFRYPYDLGSDDEYQFMIRFDIYETGGQGLEANRSVTKKLDDDALELQKKMAEQPASKEDKKKAGIGDYIENGLLAAGNAASVTVQGVTNIVGKGVPEDPSQLGKGRDTFVEEYMGFNNETTFVCSVYMYLPGSFNVTYGLEYESADVSGLILAKMLASLTDSAKMGSQAQAGMARRMGLSIAKSADSLAETLGLGGGIVSSVQASTRQVANPLVIHMFKGVQRRKFKFDFTMIPRNETESMAVDNICKTFRRYAHPRRDSTGLFLDFPAEFNITFLYKNEEVIRIPKIRKCALSSINITYGEDVFTATKVDTQGKVSPTKITMSLDFEELELLNQQTIDDHGV